ncbi:TPA: hypothetical protein ACOFD8_000966 [Stenotrophomonas maltophilia]|jgi:hypothetical protein|uniref:hypothetical protein n=1 Tax=Stenotrophomonas TaxID=40323 RepID=UPI00062D733D|nr:hypothetical protein [Stenotrophomonas maltophilia]HEL4234025.1 hypothetical protein [Stenotrophomonas maltophilia]HEL7749434.1 hypothetical protein [Stenotrophomonas maltophilia]
MDAISAALSPIEALALAVFIRLTIVVMDRFGTWVMVRPLMSVLHSIGLNNNFGTLPVGKKCDRIQG